MSDNNSSINTSHPSSEEQKLLAHLQKEIGNLENTRHARHTRHAIHASHITKIRTLSNYNRFLDTTITTSIIKTLIRSVIIHFL